MHRPGYRFSSKDKTLAWALLIIGLTVATLSGIFHWGKQIAWIDELTHLYNSFALALLLAVVFFGHALLRDGKSGSTAMILTTALVALGIGGIWEISEWIYDQYCATQTNAIYGKTYTIIDLALDGLGALAGGIQASRMARP